MTLLAAALWLGGCETSTPDGYFANASRSSQLDDPNGGTPGSPPPSSGGCTNSSESFTVTPRTDVGALDIVFVPDSSGSFDTEKTEIANSISAFIANLPTSLDYNIGVMPAHAGSLSGKLFKAGTEPLVLKKSANLSVNTLSGYLKSKLTQIPSEDETDGGEIASVSLTNALKAANLTASQAAGIFRSTAALAVIVVSDEQDICYDYLANQSRVFDPDLLELPAKSTYCGSGATAINAASVVRGLKTLKGNLPLSVNAIAYTGANPVPNSGENEIGYGLLDMALLGGGVSVDMADPDPNAIRTGLSDIGKLIATKISYATDFTLSKSTVVASSVKVSTDNGGLLPATAYNFSGGQVHLTAPPASYGHVTVDYCYR